MIRKIDEFSTLNDFLNSVRQKNKDRKACFLALQRLLNGKQSKREVELGIVSVKAGTTHASFYLTAEGLSPGDRTIILVRPLFSQLGKLKPGEAWESVETRGKQIGRIGSIQGLEPDTDHEFIVLVRNCDGYQIAAPRRDYFRTSLSEI